MAKPQTGLVITSALRRLEGLQPLFKVVNKTKKFAHFYALNAAQRLDLGFGARFRDFGLF